MRVSLMTGFEGVLAGVAILVAAVLISAPTLGAYGWGLFVATPFVVGMTTGFIVNRSAPLSMGRTISHVLAAGALGGLALLMLALEGFMCILLVAPLGLGAAALGGVFGRSIAMLGHGGRKPLMSVAVLPMLFVLEASMPPATPINTDESIDIAASPDEVWQRASDLEKTQGGRECLPLGRHACHATTDRRYLFRTLPRSALA